MTKEEKKQALQEAQRETNLFIAQKRIELLDAHLELEDVKASDDYKLSLVEILKHYKKPLALSFIVQAMPDNGLLKAARKSLCEPEDGSPKVIDEYKDKEDKTKVMIKLLAQATPIASQQAPEVPNMVEAASPTKPGTVVAEPVATATPKAE